jgi:hypothetical protein
MSSAWSVVICEGFHDRDFWRGLLLHLGVTDPGAPTAPSSERRRVDSPDGKPVARGRYGFRTATNGFIEIAPARGKSKLRPALAGTLKRPGVNQIVVGFEDDSLAPKTTAAARCENLLLTVKELDPAATIDGDRIRFADRTVCPVLWHADVTDLPGVPPLQQLERLACCAVVRAYAERGSAVKAWLASRENPPKDSPKAFVWSHMAGWFPERGCDNFYSALWDDAKIAANLKSLLESAGVWKIAEELAR